MAKINNKSIYPLEDLPSLLDYLIGSKDKNGKTKNFSLQSIISLINGVNGVNAIQYKFYNELTPDVDYETPGAFFSNNNETNVNNFTSLIFNKSTLANYDLTVLFDFLADVEDLYFGVSNPENPNNFFTFKIKSISNQTDYFIVEVEPYNGMYIGELSNESIYSLYWETKEWISDIEDINANLDLKLDSGGYTGSGQDLKNAIDAVNTNLITNYYTKPEIDSKISAAIRFKGNVATYASLPSTGMIVGDMYNVLDTGKNYAWTGTEWDDLGGTFDVSGKEDKTNKQNSLVPDGTGQKYTTVDSVNAGLTLKLDKGTYLGNAQDLKNDIDNIFVPNTLISSVDPTRSGNTFTYPSNQYVVLINKTVRTNPAQLVTTIDVASTNDHRRIDLIWFRSDNILVKTIGTESLTVAAQPSIPAGQVGVPISFINIIGNNVQNPTPIVNEISIQDSNGIERFRVPSNGFMRFKGGSLNAPMKMLEINPLVANRIYLSSTGDDSLAEPENPARAFKTLNGAVTWLLAQSHLGLNWYIETLDNTSFTYSLNMSGTGGLGKFLNGFNIINNSQATVILLNNFEVRQQNIFNFGRGTLVYDWTDTSVQVGNAMSNFSTPIFRHDISNVEFRNTSASTIILGRGNYRLLCDNVVTNYINWGIVNVRVNSPIFSDIYPTNVKIRINSITNYNGTGQAGKDFFLGNGGGPGELIIDNYINQSTAGVQQIKAVSLNIRQITSPNTITLLLYQTLSLDKNTSYTNVQFPKQNAVLGAYNRPIINGNGNILTVNYTIASSSFFATTNNSYKTQPNQYTPTQETVTSNVTIVITGTITRMATIDYRIYGEQFVFDNVNINLPSGVPIVIANNFFTPDCGYQLIFKNSVNIYNNGYIISGSITNAFALTISKLFLIQENASIYHDFGKINQSNLFPPINQMNTYNNIRRNELRISSVEQIINNSVRSDYTYVIDGTLTLTSGQYIDIPTGGCTIIGYGFDVSKIIKNVAGETIFRSISGGCGNIVFKDIAISSGLGSVFNCTDSDGTHAVEFNDLNFETCASLGILNGFRQFTGTTCGFYNCSDGLTFEGNWSGFKLTNSNIISFGASGTLFKKGTSTLFSNRFMASLNLQIASNSKVCDFLDSNFTNKKALQFIDSYTKVNGVVLDDTTTPTEKDGTAIMFPNISVHSNKCFFSRNIGTRNSSLFTKGAKTFVLDGVQTVFQIAHGLGVEPDSINLTFSNGGNTDFLDADRIKDATNITISTHNVPASGSIIVYWQAWYN